MIKIYKKTVWSFTPQDMYKIYLNFAIVVLEK